jgi:signal transduction histidine kinase
MIHYLPNVRSNAYGFGALAEAAAQARADRSRQVEINLSRLSWFDANMAAPLGAVIATLTDALKSVTVIGAPEAQEKILRKNGFLASFGYSAIPDTNRTTMPYRRFKLSDMALFSDYLQTHLRSKGLPSMTSELALVFQQSLYEIFTNSILHSRSKAGVFVCGQFFPLNGRLDISIADAGIGIPHKVNETFSVSLSPVAALRWALQEGHTTKTNGHPGGGGLKLIRNFVRHNGGRFQIASGGAFWEFCSGQETFTPLAVPFPGTVINLEVNTADTKSYCLAPSPA